MYHSVRSSVQVSRGMSATQMFIAIDARRHCECGRLWRVSAFADECTHQAFPLSAGEVHPDGSLECVWHGARFDCLTGAVQQGPATDALPTFPVRIEGNRVLVGPPEGSL